MSVVAVIAAAGQGTRFGSQGPKALIELAGEPLLVLSARAMIDSGAVDRIVVTAPKSDVSYFSAVLEHAGIAGDVVAGGATRQLSVAAGLDACGDADYVLIHDAARPLVPAQTVRAVVDALTAGHPAVVPALPVTDTIKSVSGEVAPGVEAVEQTLERASLRAMQTPQGFALAAIREAHAAFASLGATEESAAPDDAALAEAAGIPVVLVRGSERAMKITHPIDLAVAELLAANPELG